jgi:hypothetical protein
LQIKKIWTENINFLQTLAHWSVACPGAMGIVGNCLSLNFLENQAMMLVSD